MSRLSCKELVELVTEYLENTLPEPDRIRFETHLSGCTGCTHYLEQIRHTVALTGKLTTETIDPAVESELLKIFRDWKTSR